MRVSSLPFFILDARLLHPQPSCPFFQQCSPQSHCHLHRAPRPRPVPVTSTLLPCCMKENKALVTFPANYAAPAEMGLPNTGQRTRHLSESGRGQGCGAHQFPAGGSERRTGKEHKTGAQRKEKGTGYWRGSRARRPKSLQRATVGRNRQLSAKEEALRGGVGDCATRTGKRGRSGSSLSIAPPQAALRGKVVFSVNICRA